MAKKCDNKSCSCMVLDGVAYCSRHKNGPSNNHKSHSSHKNDSKFGLFREDGRVGIGMGLSRLSRQDRENWERKLREENAQKK